MSRPLLLDTDIGSDVDDALALALVLAAPQEFELVAVTTVARDTRLRARIAARLLGIAGRREVEVCAGERGALLRGEERFGWWGHEEKCFSEGPDAPVSNELAPERMVRAAREVPGLEIAAIGPLTNVARALALDPDLPRRVGGLTIMGGHVREVRIGDHVCKPGIDYNLCSDPEATMAVLGAGFRTTLVPADVTLRVWMRVRDLERLETAGALGAALAHQVRLWASVQHEIFPKLGGTLEPDNVAFLHDPLTIQALIDATPLRFETLRIVPTIERGILRTLEVDPGLGLGAEMRVATDVDARAAEKAMLERIGAG